MTEIPAWLPCLAVVIVVILGYFISKFLISRSSCQRCQTARRRAPREPDMTSQDKHEGMKVTAETVDNEKCMQVFTLPPSYEECMTSQSHHVKIDQPPSYTEYQAETSGSADNLITTSQAKY